MRVSDTDFARIYKEPIPTRLCPAAGDSELSHSSKSHPSNNRLDVITATIRLFLWILYTNYSPSGECGDTGALYPFRIYHGVYALT